MPNILRNRNLVVYNTMATTPTRTAPKPEPILAAPPVKGTGVVVTGLGVAVAGLAGTDAAGVLVGMTGLAVVAPRVIGVVGAGCATVEVPTLMTGTVT